VKPQGKRLCQACGGEIPVGLELCPICAFRGLLDDGHQTIEGTLDPAPSLSAFRFDHYQILTQEDGTPLELGRGAMGVTYKALDVNLQCAAALKVINARLIGDESAHRRFVREARAAASVRHPNVASVFHLGKSGESFFYAMEYVGGETLGNLIERSGQLEPKIALEIMSQVAAGLAAIHEQNLVHRDIKSTNIMASFKNDGQITAKIIDLGLAKSVAEASPEISAAILGAFAGTPEFASPEQFAGVGVDIRSDLYSLGVVLWEMLTGQVVFRGSAAEVMYQHQHAPLPFKQLQGVPQPVVVLLDALLEKDPSRRFQSPADVLKAIPRITAAIDARRRITRRSMWKTPSTACQGGPRKPSTRLAPKKISVSRLPVTGSDVFGREEDIAFLDRAWANQQVNVVTIVAWAGVGKSTLINHWLRRMAAKHYRSAELVFGWSFYSQGSDGDISSADEFLDAALNWFHDPDPRLGTAWEKGERLAKLIAHRRTLLILDGLEPLQNPPGPQEGRLHEPSLQALIRELAAFNKGLCVITTRLPVADIVDHQRTSALRRDLEHLSNDAGAKLLRALGVKGDDEKLRRASDEFGGHCLALTLLGSYLTDAYHGDVRFRKEVSERLAHDVRQGVHARKVMASYQTWFGEGPELSVLRIIGLFDRPTDEKAIRALLKPPAIRGLTECLADLSQTEWRTVLAKLRRARLLSGEDPHNRGHLDAHPLVREYFGQQLRSERTEAWQECNRRLFCHYQALAPQLPENFRDMEPLFLAVICGCHAGFYHDALNEVYIPRIQRGDAFFAANTLGARGPLLSALVHFFEQGRWGSLVENCSERQGLSAEDQLYILTQSGLYLTATRGLGSPEARICYARAESLCNSLNRPVLLYVALMGQWRFSVMNDKLTAAMQIAERVHSLAREQNESALMIGAYRALAGTLLFSGDFEAARKYAKLGVEVWRSGGAQPHAEFLDPPVVVCLCYEAISEWHFGESSSCQSAIAEAISLAKELNDMVGLASALHFAASVAQYNRNATEVERFASELIELSTRRNFSYWLATSTIFRGWARSVSGDTAQGISLIEDGIEDFRATGVTLAVPYWLAIKAEALYLADRISEALEAISEAEAMLERTGERNWRAEHHRLRGLLLAAIGASESQIEASLGTAIRIAREQKSVSLEKRAEATYQEYRLQKVSRSEGRGIRLPLG
jgi:serine/threonine protein kinase/predicted ATPase